MEIVKYLIEKLRVNVDQVNKNDENCLFIACRHKHVQLVEYLCQKCVKPRGSIDINYECKRNGLTVFGRAVLQG